MSKQSKRTDQVLPEAAAPSGGGSEEPGDGKLNSATLAELAQQCAAEVLLEPPAGAKEIRRATP